MTPFRCCGCQRAGTKGQDCCTVYNSVKRYILFVRKTLKSTYSRFYMRRTGKIQNVGMSDAIVKRQK